MFEYVTSNQLKVSLSEYFDDGNLHSQCISTHPAVLQQTTKLLRSSNDSAQEIEFYCGSVTRP